MFIRLKIKLYTLTIPILKIEQKWVLELSKGVTYIDKCFSKPIELCECTINQ